MPLINHIGQEKAVGHNGSPGVEGGADHLGRELGPAGHEQKSFARQCQIVLLTQENLANGVPSRRPSRIGALNYFMSMLSEPIRQQPALRGFPGAIEAVKRDE
jgi:hypothetical protein